MIILIASATSIASLREYCSYLQPKAAQNRFAKGVMLVQLHSVTLGPGFQKRNSTGHKGMSSCSPKFLLAPDSAPMTRPQPSQFSPQNTLLILRPWATLYLDNKLSCHANYARSTIMRRNPIPQPILPDLVGHTVLIDSTDSGWLHRHQLTPAISLSIPNITYVAAFFLVGYFRKTLIRQLPRVEWLSLQLRHVESDRQSSSTLVP